MPLSILIPMVILGIAGIAVLLHVLGLTRPASFDTQEDASRAWLREFPEHHTTRVVLSHDRHAALVETAQGPGVVWAMGADSTARFLNGAQIARTRKGLRIALPDYTAPRIHLTLDADEADQWPSLMERQT
ncbi:MAG: hypothetical protein AAFW87_07605 [Pseudomonadota bacterium]